MLLVGPGRHTVALAPRVDQEPSRDVHERDMIPSFFAPAWWSGHRFIPTQSILNSFV